MILGLILLLTAPAVSGGYQWIDENGVRHYSDVEDFPEPLTVEPKPKGVAIERYYYVAVHQQIKRNWQPDFEIRPDHVAVVLVTILSSGNIKAAQIEKPSGNDQLDKTALDTVWQANPLPPFPASFTKKEIKLGIRFSRTQSEQAPQTPTK